MLLWTNLSVRTLSEDRTPPFSSISKNWKGIPLISASIIVSLIGATRTSEGLAVTCVFDEALYQNGIKVDDESFNSINLIHDIFHGDWNYKILPSHEIV